ncbi:MAG: FKBP-type peptidyl-prolyl cis-trans isomerase [Solirubrobacterales bacterium]|nr:FKBP-type peptidyl-prolyl cis-trans isomerase [Solirubrobacterales bacterium]
MRQRLLLSAAVAVLAGALGACGGSKAPGVQAAPSAGATSPSTPAATPTTPTTATSTATTPKPPSPLSKKPAVAVPKGPAPTKLVVKDLIAGTGSAAKSGGSLAVNYVGVLYKGGKEFDSSWKTGKPFSFQLGQGSVIPGWDQGLTGMKVGGRRELIIPPQLAYGKQGSPPTIPPNSTLVFVIDLLDAK